jgi:alpha-glucosidase
MFAYRHDILKTLIADGVKLVVLGPQESIADLPEYKKLADKSNVDHTLRYLSYHPEMKLLVVAQENVLANPRHMYVGDNQVIRVFADALYKVAGMRPVIPDYRGNQQYELRVKRLDLEFDKAVTELFDKAKAAKKWQGTAALEDKFAYWTAGVLAYFDALGQDAAPNDFRSTVNTREKLKEYDPGLFTFVSEVMAYETKVDWRYRP